jgi:transcription elongation GreA/GreB family factor
MSLKEKLYRHCLLHIEERLTRAKIEIAQIQSSANNETKSSAGDKYETGRAMAQLEIERNTQQLHEAEKLLTTLTDVKKNKTLNIAGRGSLVYTSQGIYYIAISLGLVEVEQQKIFVISDQSPIGKLLMGKKIGEAIRWNGKDYELQKIE